MAMEGHSLLANALLLSQSLREAINSLTSFRVLELEEMITDEVRGDGLRLDPTKLTIDVSRSGYSSKQVEHLLLSKHNIQIEKSTYNTLTVLITIGATRSKLNRLFLALENIEKMSGRYLGPSASIPTDFALSLSSIRFVPRMAFYCEGERLALRESVNRIASAMVVPYPPGIPLLVPGQIITPEIVAELQCYREYDVEIHGLSEGMLTVMTAEEERRLEALGFGLDENSEEP
jgi:arginine/lysine/ornithine decarboxylase